MATAAHLPNRRSRIAARALLLLGLAALAFGVANSRLMRSTDAPSNGQATAARGGGAALDQTGEPASSAGPAATPEPRLVVTFRLDPAVTRGLYLGDRWVSPPEFRFAQAGDEYVVQAKLQSIDEWGDRSDLSGNWAASDPEMVAITRGQGQVTLVVREPGDSRVTVTSGSERKELRIHARKTPDAMDVAIRQ